MEWNFSNHFWQSSPLHMDKMQSVRWFEWIMDCSGNAEIHRLKFRLAKVLQRMGLVDNIACCQRGKHPLRYLMASPVSPGKIRLYFGNVHIPGYLSIHSGLGHNRVFNKVDCSWLLSYYPIRKFFPLYYSSYILGSMGASSRPCGNNTQRNAYFV